MDGAGDMSFMFGFLAFIGFFAMAFVSSEGVKISKKWFSIPVIFAVFSFIVGFFIPTTKEMAAIILLPKITNAIQNNEELKKLPENVLQLANDWINELKPKAKDK